MSASATAHPWRESIEALTMAVALALFLKGFIVEATRIPTGSMQPTLIGDARSGIFDRILVDKLSYTWRDPERFEIAVFRYPLDRSKSFVKRVVGIGPEELEIRGGDLFVRATPAEPWRILRRPRAVQAETWKPLEGEPALAASWQRMEGAADWRLAGRSIQARGDGKARWRPDRGPITDLYLDGYPEPLQSLIAPHPAGSGAHMVGDLRVQGRVRALPGLLWARLQLYEGERRYWFEFPGEAAGDSARAQIRVFTVRGNEEVEIARSVSAQASTLQAGRWYAFGAQNLDDLLELELDGQSLVQLEIEPAAEALSCASLELQGEGADFEELMLSRDIYYTTDRAMSSRVEIPAGHYFMLGDNTQDSSDGREWNLARLRDTHSGAIWRGNARSGENPVVWGHGEEDGPWTFFRDEWGEAHHFPAGRSEAVAPQAAPCVARELIQGRAFALFWPQIPWKGVWRLGWLH